MKYKITETREFIIEAKNQDEALKIYSESLHNNDTLTIENIDIEDIDYIRKTLNI